MSGLDDLKACVGDWRGTNHLWLDADGPPDESASAAEVAMLDGGRIGIGQTWHFGGKARVGSFVFGHDPAAGVATASWTDPFHTGGRPMAFSGVVRPDGTVDVRGTYAAPPGPDWGWRIEVAAPSPGALEIVMHNIHPDGEQDLAVRATYARA